MTSSHDDKQVPGGVAPYTSPRITVLGEVSDLTLKSFNASDGASFFGVPEGFTS